MKIDNCEVLGLNENVFRIRVQIKNLGIFGTNVIKETESYQAEYPVHIYIEPTDGLKIFSRPNIYEISSLSSMESCYVEWIVKCENTNSLTIVTNHPKAKTPKVNFKLYKE